jgi:hypothetical protein
MAVDNIFIDVFKYDKYTTFPLFNGLSDHDAQLIVLNYVKVDIKSVRSKIIRKTDHFTMLDFQYKLSFET